MRFEHLLEKSEDEKNYSKAVTFTLQDVFGQLFDVQSVRETNLAANQWLSDVKRFKFAKEGEQQQPAVYEKPEKDNEIHSEARGDEEDDESYSVTLTPMQIRTFIITVNEQL